MRYRSNLLLHVILDSIRENAPNVEISCTIVLQPDGQAKFPWHPIRSIPTFHKKVKEEHFLDLYSTNLVNTGLFRYVSFKYVNHPTQIGNSLQVKALVTSGIRPPCGLFAGSVRPKTVAIAGSPCGGLKELASTVEVVRPKISGRGP